MTIQAVNIRRTTIVFTMRTTIDYSRTLTGSRQRRPTGKTHRLHTVFLDMDSPFGRFIASEGNLKCRPLLLLPVIFGLITYGGIISISALMDSSLVGLVTVL